MRTVFWLSALALIGYAVFVYEPEELRSMRAYCRERGSDVEVRGNAITFFGHRNYHYACRFDEEWHRNVQKGIEL